MSSYFSFFKIKFYISTEVVSGSCTSAPNLSWKYGDNHVDLRDPSGYLHYLQKTARAVALLTILL